MATIKVITERELARLLRAEGADPEAAYDYIISLNECAFMALQGAKFAYVEMAEGNLLIMARGLIVRTTYIDPLPECVVDQFFDIAGDNLVPFEEIEADYVRKYKKP